MPQGAAGRVEMAIDFKTFAKVVGPIADARFPVLIRGRHGVGKSETDNRDAKPSLANLCHGQANTTYRDKSFIHHTNGACRSSMLTYSAR